MESDSLLEEGAPIVPEPPLPNWTPNQKQYQTDGERIETAFRKYFRKADNSQSNDVNEIIVCHANVIRYATMMPIYCSRIYFYIYFRGIRKRKLGRFSFNQQYHQ